MALESACALLCRKAWAKVQMESATAENFSERAAAWRRARKDVLKMDAEEVAAGNPLWLGLPEPEKQQELF